MLWNRDGLVLGAEGVYRRVERRMFYQDVLVPWEWEQIMGRTDNR